MIAVTANGGASAPEATVVKSAGPRADIGTGGSVGREGPIGADWCRLASSFVAQRVRLPETGCG